MRWLIKRCGECGEYTLKEVCPRCGSHTRTPHPPRFSLEDKYTKYRLQGSRLENTGKDEASPGSNA